MNYFVFNIYWIPLWSSITVAFNVGEITPWGGFMCCGGDIVICVIWGAILVSRGAIVAGWNIQQFWIDSKKAILASLESKHLMHFRLLDRKNGHETMISHWWHNIQTNIVLCNAGMGTCCPRERLIWPASKFLLPKLECNITSKQSSMISRQWRI